MAMDITQQYMNIWHKVDARNPWMNILFLLKWYAPAKVDRSFSHLTIS